MSCSNYDSIFKSTTGVCEARFSNTWTLGDSFRCSLLHLLLGLLSLFGLFQVVLELVLQLSCFLLVLRWLLLIRPPGTSSLMSWGSRPGLRFLLLPSPVLWGALCPSPLLLSPAWRRPPLIFVTAFVTPRTTFFATSTAAKGLILLLIHQDS